MDFGLLGPIELTGDRQLDLGPPQQRVVLASLLMDAGRVVTVESLVDRVWDEAPPSAPRSALYAHVSRLRGLVGAVVARRGGGYLLDVDPDRVDVHRFHRLIAMGQEVGRPDIERAQLLWDALHLWRGTPLAGIPGGWAARVRVRLAQQRLDAAVCWADLQRSLGRPSVVIGVARQLLAEYPLAEPLVAALMGALVAEDRQAEALACYATVRARLIEDLGCEPGQQLQDLYLALLRSDGLTGAAPAARPGLPDPVRPAPAQLPLAVRGFVGRAEQLARLDAILADASGNPSTVVISAVSGTAGVGKTALAIHWAHSVKGLFPDGQLHVNLRGFGPQASAVDPLEAVRGFLVTMGIEPDRVPADPDARTGLYRTVLADKQILLVLDNARDAAQVRPLLPGTPGCLVLVTSRSTLDGLVAGEGAYSVPLDLLATVDARRLLAERIGRDRVEAEPRAVDEIITRCARLPLALAIVAARAAGHPQSPLGTFAGELGDARGTLDALSSGDTATDVRAVFSWSHRHLSAQSARLFRLLGLHPGPEISVPAVASLAALPVNQIRTQLAELTNAHLLTEHAPGRYSLHDLLHAYARERAQRTETEDDIRTTTMRILEHYLRTGHAAALVLSPQRTAIPIALPTPPPALTIEELPDSQRAITWFTDERAVLLGAIDLAAGQGMDVYAFQLAWCLPDFFSRRGLWHDWLATQRAALAAAEHLAHPHARANAHRNLALANVRLGRYDEAETELRKALRIHQQLDDTLGQAHTHYSLSWMYGQQGRYVQAMEASQQALAGFQAAEDWQGQADALNSMGWEHAQIGDFPQALALCGKALRIHQRTRYVMGEAATWDSLGYIHHRLNEHREAARAYHNALALYQQIGHRYQQSVVLHHIGDARSAIGDVASAHDAWLRALDILNEISHPRAEILREKVDRSRPAARTAETSR